MSTRHTWLTLWPILLTLLLATSLATHRVSAETTASGDELRLDFRDNQPAPGGNWNTIPNASRNGTVSNLTSFNSGTPTAVSYTGTGWNSQVGSPAVWPVGDKAWVADVAADDGFSVGNSTATITISGLTGSHYLVELVIASTYSEIADYTLAGNFASRSYHCTVGVNGDNFNARTNGSLAGNWLIWENVAPNNGQIVITVEALGSGNYGDVNALRLVELPQTSAAVMDAYRTTTCAGGLYAENDTFVQDAGDALAFTPTSTQGNTDTDLPAGVAQRWVRTWDCTLTDTNSNGGTVDLTFNFIQADMNKRLPPMGNPANYKLLHRAGTSGDFAVIASATAVDTANWTVSFANVDVQTAPLCSQITLGTTNAATSPTAVSLQKPATTQPQASAAFTLQIASVCLALLLATGWAVRRHS